MDSVSGISYYLVSHQMLDAIRHVTNDNFVFQQHSASVHVVFNTVHLVTG